MTSAELLTDALKRNLEMVKGTLSDFSDADMLVRPCPGANHTAWQLGHLINSESGMLNGVKPGLAPQLPEGFSDKFKKDTSKNDDPNSFPKKAELVDTFTKVREASIGWAKGLSQAELDQPSPERMRNWAPTVGHMIAMMPGHTAMHVGQFQVIRRKLGKPILF